jgi:hypothetical protein
MHRMQQRRRKNAKTATESSRREKRAALRKYLRQNNWLVLLACLCAVALVLLILVLSGGKKSEQTAAPDKTARYEKGYLCAAEATVPYYDKDLTQKGTAARGTQVTYTTREPIVKDGVEYDLTYVSATAFGYVATTAITQDPNAVVTEKTVYVRTPQNLRLSADGAELGELVTQGTELSVEGYDKLENGVIHLYKVAYNGKTGYISGEYTATTKEAATEVYDRFGVYATHASREDLYGGGDGGSLDYYPRAKASFQDNPMPNPCYSLYLTCDAKILANIDQYIAYAKSTKINAFVVNIMDGTSVAYPSEVFKTYSPTAYSYANNTTENFKAAIQKIKDAGFYVIGRLTTFNDSFFAEDHPECAIDGADGQPLYIAKSYWPSAYSRYAWEYKVALAEDAVKTIGFDEIQFDYVRFPDGTYQYEKAGTIDYHNEYGETKAQAIQRFLMYACDELHNLGVYVSADVFGETCETYVTSYGQYWAAISNVVDVISGMPYPDHFSQNGTYRPWQHPRDTILEWAKKAALRQKETPSPAIARTWIQAYDAIRYPYNTYGPDEVGGEIQALQDAGLQGGFMAWNASCSLEKMQVLKPAYDALP